MCIVGEKSTVLSPPNVQPGWLSLVGAGLASEPIHMVRSAPTLAPTVSFPPDRVRSEDNLRDDLILHPVEENNALLAVSSLLILMLEASLLVGIALICHYDRHTCWPVRHTFMT